MQNGVKQVVIIFIILVSGCLWHSCHTGEPGDFVLFDFENESDLDNLNWKCHSLFSISDRYASEGGKSLKVELYPSNYPGVSFKKYKRNWDGYQEVSFDGFNPDKKKIRLVVRIDDSQAEPNYGDRYNKGFDLISGENKIRIPFCDLKTSDGKRTLDVRKIEKLILFVVRPEKKIHLYLDTFKLTK